MSIFLTLAIFVANAIAILLVYQFVKKLEQTDKVIFIAMSVAIIYIAVSLIYWISGFGIDKSVNEATKNFLTFLFVPVNVILLVPFVATKYTKYKAKKISKRDFAERLIKVVLVGIVLLTIECIYFKSIKKNIKIINENIQNVKSQTNTITDEKENEKTNTIVNEIAD